MHNNFIRMPPDSTGKKVLAAPLTIVGVTNASNFKEDNIVVGGTSGATMVVRSINTYDNLIYCKYLNEGQEGTDFSINENLLVEGVIKSTVSVLPYKSYHNMVSIVSHDNPFHGQRVDAQGQSYIRYEEGSQILDALGRAKTSRENIVGNYKFKYLAKWDEFFSTITSGTASKSMNSKHSGLVMSCGTTNNDSINLVSNKYHYNSTGLGLYTDMLVSTGDTGKTNLIRDWGYGDASNGIFFRLKNASLYIVLRSDITGVVVDTEIAQTDWNRDQLDGSGLSKVTLNTTKINRYWYDLHRGVRLRLGIYGEKGERIVCHEFIAANSTNQLLLSTLNLPVYTKQYNIGTTISTSEMTFYEGVVSIEGELSFIYARFEGSSGNAKTITSSTWIPAFSIRPKLTSNHSICLPNTLSISAVLSSDTNIDGRIKIEIFKNPSSLTDATFALSKTNSKYEYDNVATGITGGNPVAEFFIKGTDNIDLTKYFNYLDEYLALDLNNLQNTYSIAVKALSQNCDVMCALTWQEVILG